MDRRQFLAAAAATGLAACSGDDGPVTSVTVTTAGETTGDTTPIETVEAVDSPEGDFAAGVFALGVASGDPTSASVVLWTRLVADPLVDDDAMGTDDIEVAWDIASDREMTTLVASGLATATAAFAHSVHLEVEGLDGATEYFYRFRVGDQTSQVGRTKTTPAAGVSADQLKIVMASCQDLQWGHYASWRRASEVEDLDAVLFLGDYIYEFNFGDMSPTTDGTRMWTVPAPKDLGTYRTRFSQTRLDESLQAAHAAAPWIMTWDDHEVINNYSADVDPTGASAEDNRARRAAAHQAWYEHMPVRLPVADDWAEFPIHRRIEFGDLAAMHVIETRDYADVPPCRIEGELTFSDEAPLCDEVFEPGRTNLGAAQEEWLLGSLGSTGATWDLIANPIVISGIDVAEGPDDPSSYSLDSWDGYPEVRARVVERLGAGDIANPVVLTGDWHSSFVLDLSDGEGGETVAPEFLVTSISTIVFDADHTARNPHMRYFSPGNGFAVCTVTADEFRTDFHYLADVWDPDSPIERTDSWAVAAGSHEAKQV